jgi:glycosyltransferase involved in cell wall biosynthesis
MPHASVIIPAFNAADFITAAYQSIVEQTIGDWEVIFVNDGSQDDTLAVVRSLLAADKRIKVIDLPSNSGPACARNAALAMAEGDWIALLDADDRYSPDRLEVLIRAGERTGADIVLDNQYVTDPILQNVAFLAFEPRREEVVTLEFSDFLRNIQSDAFFDFGYLKPIIRRRWLMANNIEYSETLRVGEDLMLLFECYSRRAKVVLLSTPYYHYYFQSSGSIQVRSSGTNSVQYQHLLAATEQFLQKHYSRLSSLERRLVASTCEFLREEMIVMALKEDLTSFSFYGLIRSLRHPIRLLRGIYFAKRRSSLRRRRLKSLSRIQSSSTAG